MGYLTINRELTNLKTPDTISYEERDVFKRLNMTAKFNIIYDIQNIPRVTALIADM